METKQYVTWKSNIFELVFKLSAVVVFIFWFKDLYVDHSTKIWFILIDLVLALITAAVGVFSLVSAFNNAFRWQAQFDKGVWTFFPVIFPGSKRWQGKSVSFTMDELVAIEIPKFSKDAKKPPLLISYNDQGTEVTVEFIKKYSRELFDDLQAHDPDKLGVEAKANVEYWTGK